LIALRLLTPRPIFARRTLAALGATWTDWNLGPASAARLTT
jgi:hypothetical protein